MSYQNSVSTGCAILVEVGIFLGGDPRSRSLAESSRGWVPIQMVFYILPPFLRWGCLDYGGVGPLSVNTIWISTHPRDYSAKLRERGSPLHQKKSSPQLKLHTQWKHCSGITYCCTKGIYNTFKDNNA